MKDPEAVAAALQLLLGNCDDVEKKEIFAKAFSRQCIPRTDALVVEKFLRDAKKWLALAPPCNQVEQAEKNVRLALGMIVLNL